MSEERNMEQILRDKLNQVESWQEEDAERAQQHQLSEQLQFKIKMLETDLHRANKRGDGYREAFELLFRNHQPDRASIKAICEEYGEIAACNRILAKRVKELEARLSPVEGD